MSSNKLEVDMALCLRCIVDTRNWPDNQSKVSSEFRFQGVGWKLKFDKWRGQYGLHLLKCSGVNPTSPPHVSVHVENPNENGQMTEVLSQEAHLKKRELEGGWWMTIWVKEEQDIPGFVPHFFLNGILSLVVILKGEESSTDEKCVQTSLTIDPIPCSQSLSEDLDKLLDSDSNPDVDFQCGGQSIKAHRLVVSARSPVLANMLQSHWAEGATEIVNIEDMDIGTLKLFVRYLYTSRLDVDTTFETAMALYEAAHKYQVPSLARRCKQFLMEGITVQNACDVLVVADRNGDDNFVGEISVFIRKKKLPSTSEHWSDFCSSHPLLANKFLNRSNRKILIAGKPIQRPKRKHGMDLRT